MPSEATKRSTGGRITFPLVRCGRVVSRSLLNPVWLFGSTQGAGGIGGLLFTRHNGSDYFPIYDGRGNLTGMIDGVSQNGQGVVEGNIVAGYLYSTFGTKAASVGSMKDDFKFGWSTKFTDNSTELINFGKRWYDSDHGRFINRDPIGEKGGINLYAFLTNNPLGGYEYLGMGFLSKLFKKIKSFIKGVVRTFKNVVVQSLLGLIPVVGPFLAAAYGAYQGYKSGGILGAVTGFMGGFKIGKAMQGAGKTIGDAFKAGWAKASEMATVGSFVVQEGMGALVKAVDRKIRGFGKWFGQAMNAYSIATGLSEFQKSFSKSVAALGRAVVSGSPQLARAMLSGGYAGSGSRMRVDLMTFGFDVESSLSKVLKDILAPMKSALSPARMAMQLKWGAERAAFNNSIREAESINAAVARSTLGPKYTAKDSTRAYMMGSGARRYEAHKAQGRFVVNMALAAGGTATLGVGYGALIGGGLSGTGYTLTGIGVAKGTADLAFESANALDLLTGGEGRLGGSALESHVALFSESGGELAAFGNAAVDVSLSLAVDGIKGVDYVAVADTAVAAYDLVFK